MEENIQTSIPPTISNSKQKNLPLIIVSVLAILSLGISAFLGWQNYQLRQQLAQQRVTPISVISPSPIPPPSREPELTPIDEVWNQYTNYQLGFSIKIPKMMTHFYGSCKWDEEGKKPSYRPEFKLVPVKIFEDNNAVFISSKYYYGLGGETKEDSVSYFSECNKVTNSLTLLKEDKSYQQSWEIISEEAINDQELDSFIKKHYGPTCKLEEKTSTRQQGTFSLSIDVGDFQNVDEASERGCLVNYVYALRYFPQKNRVITWKLGQASTFYRDPNNPYDEEMRQSFEFID